MASPDEHRSRVLHVEDDADFAEVSATFLERESDDIAVESVQCASDGLRLLSERDVDCIVSDYDMPGMDGITFLETVRETRPKLPFILFTGKGSEEIASEAISAGVTDYLQKGGGTEQYVILANRIENAVEQYRSNRRATEQRRISEVVQRIDEALVRADTRDEIDERVCEILASAEPYKFAWIGEHDVEAETVYPRAAAGIGEDYLEEIEITTDERPTGRGPTGSAIRTGELAVMQNIPANERYEPWRDAALERGYRSSAAVPLIYEDTLFGVLNVYADRTHAFDEGECQLLSKLGETIAHAHRRVELQLEYAEQYVSMYEDLPAMVVFTRESNGEPLIEECNSTFAERLGYSQSELVGTAVADYFSDATVDEFREAEQYRQVLSGAVLREYRQLVTRVGEEFQTAFGALPRRDVSGRVIGSIELYFDISEKHSGAELGRTDALLSTLFDALPQGIIAEDESRTVLAVNHQLVELFDLPATTGDILGEDCDVLLDTFSDAFEDADAFRDGLDAVADCGEPDGGDQISHADGRTFERSYRPIELPAGDGHLWIYRDVTEQLSYEETITNLHEVATDLAICDSRDNIYEKTIEAAESLLEFNSAAIAIAEDGRLNVKALSEAMPIDEPPSLGEDEGILGKAYQSGETIRVDDAQEVSIAVKQDNQFRAVISVPIGNHAVFQAIDDEPGTFDERDVELAELLIRHTESALELLERERNLERRNDRLEEFAHVISHDLRNPLNVATTRLELLADDVESEHVDHIDRVHERMETLIEKLLTLALEGVSASEFDQIQLDSTVESCWGMVETGDAELENSVGMRIRADESRLKQLLENLIRNAIDHGREDVTVWVGPLEDGFFVEDDGPGIPESDRSDVFENGHSTKSDGTGFGLSIVEHVIDAHDWEITVTTGRDGGARFEITDVDLVDS